VTAKTYSTYLYKDIPQERFLSVAYLHAKQQGTILLHSAQSQGMSLLFLHPYETLRISKQQAKSTWKLLESFLGPLNANNDIPFCAGYLSYDLAAYCDERLTSNQFLLPEEVACFQKSSLILTYDHSTHNLHVYVEKKWESIQKKKCNDYLNQLIFNTTTIDFSWTPPSLKLVEQSDSYQSYSKKIEWIQKEIRKGNFYQVNLSQQWTFSGEISPFSSYLKLIKENPTDFSAFLNCNDSYIISSSPELFLRKSGDTLESRPIKGTAPRGSSRQEDNLLRNALISSEKDNSELLMITDLIRNDLAKISIPGSVKVPDILHCESYTNVHHLVSTVKSKAIPSYHPVQLIQKSFPGGSITGCPKVRAVESIAYLEQRYRGIYTGSIGYFTTKGNFDFNIAIRTLTYKAPLLNLQMGGAIVIDSDPEKEFEETLHKGKSIFKIFNLEDIVNDALRTL
jgi:para-aminobenzoate synthetase component I